MRRATLIVNPNAGTAGRFHRQFFALQRVFARHAVAIDLVETTPAPDSAKLLAVQAARRSDRVIACGGDGTVHGVLQGVANTAASLGTLPFGTANALARNLGLPSDPVAALEMLLAFEPRIIPLGLAQTEQQTRWFLVMAGAGPDGRLVHDMRLAAKARIGRNAYYLEAARLFLTRSFPTFSVRYRTAAGEHWRSCEAVSVMVSRVPDLGGLFRGLTADSRLHHPHLVAKVLSAPAYLSLPAWLAAGTLRLSAANPWLTTLQIDEIHCSAAQSATHTLAQADGEPIGPIPLSLKIVPNCLQLLMRPPDSAWQAP